MKQNKLRTNQIDGGRSVGHGVAWLGQSGAMLGLVAVLAFGLTACSTTPKVQTIAKPGIDYSRYHTFALMPLPTNGPASDPGLMQRVAGPARQAAAEALIAKGLAGEEHAKADIAVHIRGKFLPKVQLVDLGYHPGPPPPGYEDFYQGGIVSSPNQTMYNYEERTLIIEIYDTKAKDIVWTGWSKADSSNEVNVERLQNAIRGILAGFPAGKTAAKP